MHKKQPEKLKKFFENKVQHKSFWQTFRSAAQKLRFPDKISKLMYVWVIPMLLPGMVLADINFKYSVDSFDPFLCYVYRMHLIKVTRSRRDFLGAIKYFSSEKSSSISSTYTHSQCFAVGHAQMLMVIMGKFRHDGHG